MRGVIYTAIKGQHQDKGGNCRGDMICVGGADERMGAAVGGAAAGIVQMRD